MAVTIPRVSSAEAQTPGESGGLWQKLDRDPSLIPGALHMTLDDVRLRHGRFRATATLFLSQRSNQRARRLVAS
jgi:hypothetical protein